MIALECTAPFAMPPILTITYVSRAAVQLPVQSLRFLTPWALEISDDYFRLWRTEGLSESQSKFTFANASTSPASRISCRRRYIWESSRASTLHRQHLRRRRARDQNKDSAARAALSPDAARDCAGSRDRARRHQARGVTAHREGDESGDRGGADDRPGGVVCDHGADKVSVVWRGIGSVCSTGLWGDCCRFR